MLRILGITIKKWQTIMKDTNIFYALFYTHWKYQIKTFLWMDYLYEKLFSIILPEKWRTESMKDPELRNNIYVRKRDFGLGSFYARLGIMGLLYCKFTLIGFPIARIIEKHGLSRSISSAIPLGVIFIIVWIIDDLYLQESQYRKYFNKYEKKETSWKRKWGIIAFLDVLFSFACLYFGVKIGDSI